MRVPNVKKYLRAILTLTAALVVPASVVGTPVSASTNINNTNPWLNRRVLNIAHQGGEIEAPSDTMFAFKTAQAKGADVLELDVHATADGEIVALHDATVDRTTDGTGRVDQLTLEQIKALDAAHWFVPDCGTCHGRPDADYSYRGFATGERPLPPELSDFEPNDFKIPTLREVLQQFPDEFINIEIKSTAPDTTPYEAKIASLLNEFGRNSDTIVASFSDTAMTLFKLNPAAVSTSPGKITTGLFWASAQGSLPGIPLPGHHALQVPVEYEGLTIITPSFVTKAHSNGLAVHVWTIDDRGEMERLIDTGVDGIMTNRPSLLEEVLKEKGVKYPH